MIRAFASGEIPQAFIITGEQLEFTECAEVVEKSAYDAAVEELRRVVMAYDNIGADRTFKNTDAAARAARAFLQSERVR